MERIILFGASRGGRNFVINKGEQYRIIAIADNDASKQGQEIEGIPIINPSEILNYSFDKIVIASMYFRAISKQLLELGISEGQIKYASKNSMKVVQFPFSNPEILKKAESLIGLLSNILKDEQYYYTFGTALAIVRDGELIPWDDDIDIAIYHWDAEKIKNIILENSSLFDEIIDNKIYFRKYPDESPTSISIDCIKDNEVVFNINLDCIHVEGDDAKTEIDRLPLHYFNTPSKYHFKGIEIKLPTNYTEYLTHVYKDWKTVKKHTSFFNNTTTYEEPTVKVNAELIHESNKLGKSL